MADTLTHGELYRKLKKRVVSAFKKKILTKAYATGSNFFMMTTGEELYRADGVETKEYEPWTTGSDYTYWDFEVIFPVELQRTEAKLSIRSHDRSRYGVDEWIKVTVFMGETAQVVLHAIRSDKMPKEEELDPMIVDGWRYEVYIPGPWERWLNTENIKKYFAKRKKKLLLEGQREEESEKLKKLQEPVSAEELEMARRFGIV